jgi:hypothetical protein
MAEFYQGGLVHPNAEIHLTDDAYSCIEGDISNIRQEKQHVHIKDIEAYGVPTGSGESADWDSNQTVGEYEGRKYQYVGGGAWYPFKKNEVRDRWPSP